MDPTKAEREKKRGTWANHLDYMMTNIGFTVGLGNIWRYPYLAYENGGFTFIVPYIISVLIAGLPLYCLEGFLGQLSGLGAHAHGALAPLFADCSSKLDDDNCTSLKLGNQFVNGSCCYNCLNVNHSVSSAEQFFKSYVLEYAEFDDGSLGTVSKRLAISLFLAWCLVFICIAGGIRSTGKTAYFTALFPYVMLTIFLIHGISLNGSGDGLRYYLKPNFSKVVQYKTWHDAATQVFYSLNPAMGGVVTLASYNKFHNNLERDAIVICIIDSLSSLLAGCAIFSSIGFLSYQLKKPVDKAVTKGLPLAFIALPQTMSLMGGSHFFSFAFFAMLLMLGLSSQFVLFQTSVAAIIDTFPCLRATKLANMAFTGFMCFISFLFGLVFCTQSGINVFIIFDDYCIGYTPFLVAFLETVLIAYIHGVNNFVKDISHALGYQLNRFWRMSWLITCPLFVICLFFASIATYESNKSFSNKVLPYGIRCLGWLIVTVICLTIIAFGVREILRNYRKDQRWIDLVLPTDRWDPEERNEDAIINKIMSMKFTSKHKLKDLHDDEHKTVQAGVKTGKKSDKKKAKTDGATKTETTKTNKTKPTML